MRISSWFLHRRINLSLVFYSYVSLIARVSRRCAGCSCSVFLITVHRRRRWLDNTTTSKELTTLFWRTQARALARAGDEVGEPVDATEHLLYREEKTRVGSVVLNVQVIFIELGPMSIDAPHASCRKPLVQRRDCDTLLPPAPRHPTSQHDGDRLTCS